MAKPKFDAVVEAVHYAPDGQVAWVRMYERRGPTFSDRVLISRSKLIERLKAGKHFVAGTRVAREASTFETSVFVQLRQQNGKDILVTGNAQSDKDSLAGIPAL